jgi:hypothetical protein
VGASVTRGTSCWSWRTLGLDLLESMPAAASWQRLAGADQRLPSTTAVALSSIYSATCLAARRHWPLMLGPGRRADDRAHVLSAATAPTSAQRHDPVEASRAGPPGRRRARRCSCCRIVSGTACSASSAQAAAPRLPQPADGVDAARLRAAAVATHRVYTPRVDDAARARPCAPGGRRRRRALDEELRRLSLGLGEAGRIVLTADHGHPVVRRARACCAGTTGRSPPAHRAHRGRTRAYFHLDRDADAGQRARSGSLWRAVPAAHPDEVIEAGLLAPSEVTRMRLGDLVGISPAPMC